MCKFRESPMTANRSERSTMKPFRDEEGQTLVFTALAMVILLGFMALALDASVLFRARRKMQIAADASATAAALDFYYSGSATSAKAMAQTAATANGVTNGDANGDIVTVNCSPTSGP